MTLVDPTGLSTAVISTPPMSPDPSLPPQPQNPKFKHDPNCLNISNGLICSTLFPGINGLLGLGIFKDLCQFVPSVCAPDGPAGGGSPVNLESSGRDDEQQVIRITFGHGARHVLDSDLTSEEVEAAITTSVNDSVQKATSVGPFWGRVMVRGRVVEYRAYPVSETVIHVGTYYFPKG